MKVELGFSEKDTVLCHAAVLGGEFSIDWIVELSGSRVSLIVSALEEEVQAESLDRRKPAVYAWKDPRRRGEILGTLSDEQARRSHQAVASLLIRDLPDDDAKALEVSEHLLHCFNDWVGCQWLMRAADLHITSFSREKAAACFKKVLEDLENQTGENEDRLFVRAVIEYSNVEALGFPTPSACGILQKAKARAGRLNEWSLETTVDLLVARSEFLRGDFETAERAFEEALAKVRASGEQSLPASATSVGNFFLFFQGKFRDVIDLYERSVPDVEKYPLGHFPLLASIGVGLSYAMTGHLTQGLGMLDAIRHHCMQVDDVYLAAHAACAIGTTMLAVNQVDDAMRYLKSALKEARSNSNYSILLVSALALGRCYLRKGDVEQTLRHLRLFAKNIDKGDAALQVDSHIIAVCWSMRMNELPSLPGFSFHDELNLMLKSRSVFVRGIGYRYDALQRRSEGRPHEEVARSLAASIQCLERSGNQIAVANSQIEMARCYLASGSEKKARAVMKAAARVLLPINESLIPDDLRSLISSQSPGITILKKMAELATGIAKQDSGKLLQQIVAAVNHVTGAERGGILLFNGNEGRRIELRASKNLSMEQILGESFAGPREMIERVRVSGEGSIFEGAPETDESNPRDTIRSGICVPLILNKKTIGVLYHDNRLLGNVFKESDLGILAYFGALAALGLDREKARHEVEAFKENREEELAGWEASSSDHVPRVEGVIGASAAMGAILAQVDLVAKSDAAVLVLGETGVGKNVLAEAIHRQSLRGSGPFICVQCSALTESLITSELFGHEKGAFTGATNRRVGRFELAHGGTLFLDEIGDLTLEVQARLLRVLQTKEFERVGGGKETVTSDFRLIAATNRDLKEEVRANRFREDLYYRINVVSIYLPPLRERREDIPALAGFFFQRYNAPEKTGLEKVPDEVMARLIKHDWPGNVRELENVIQRGVLFSRDSHFVLPQDFAGTGGLGTKGFMTFRENERQHILSALDRTRWKIHGPGGAAELLDLNSCTLASKMRKLGIRKAAGNARKKRKPRDP